MSSRHKISESLVRLVTFVMAKIIDEIISFPFDHFHVSPDSWIGLLTEGKFERKILRYNIKQRVNCYWKLYGEKEYNL